jgi:hypothetical protein
MGELSRKTREREELIRGMGYELRCVYECEYDNMLRRNPEFKAACSKFIAHQRLNARDSLYGGRTNALRLFYECKPGERILYKDVVSGKATQDKTNFFFILIFVLQQNIHLSTSTKGIPSVTMKLLQPISRIYQTTLESSKQKFVRLPFVPALPGVYLPTFFADPSATRLVHSGSTVQNR